jgi:hypothetical protein
MGKKTGGFQIDQDLGFQRREWRMQRAGWWALTAFVVAAVLGLFGGGVVSSARAGDEGSALWIDYERFVRVGAPSRLSVHLGTPADGNAYELHINREYFESLRIEQIVPAPERTAVGVSDVTLFFPATPPVGLVILDVQPLEPGRHPVRISTSQMQTRAFTQFAYF